MASRHSVQLDVARRLVTEITDMKLANAREGARQARRLARQHVRDGSIPMADAFDAMADAYEHEIVCWTRVRDEYLATTGEAVKA